LPNLCGKLECFRAWRAVIQAKRDGVAARDKQRWASLIRRNQVVAMTQPSENEQLSASQ
jgi:hypothetical protein